MWNGKYINILSIVDTIYSRFRNTVLLEDFSLGDASEWAYHAMGLIGAGIGYIQKVTDGNEELNHQEPVIVENYIGLLPEDLYLIKGVREYYYKIPFRESNYIYHTSLNDAQLEQNLKKEQTYYINNGVIHTSIKDCVLEISYDAFPIDNDGLPLIPDEPAFIEAIIAYISYNLARMAFIQDKITDNKFRYYEQEWIIYANSAKNRMNIPSYDAAQTLMNQSTRLIKSKNYHNWGFKYMGDTEHVTIFNRSVSRF